MLIFYCGKKKNMIKLIVFSEQFSTVKYIHTTVELISRTFYILQNWNPIFIEQQLLFSLCPGPG